MLKNKLAPVALAVAGLGAGLGGAAIAAPAANASTIHAYHHNEASGGYSSYSSCLQSFNGVVGQIRAHGGWVASSGGTCAQRGGTSRYHYYFINYNAPTKAYSYDDGGYSE